MDQGLNDLPRSSKKRNPIFFCATPIDRASTINLISCRTFQVADGDAG
jgi:hypothetical protein